MHKLVFYVGIYVIQYYSHAENHIQNGLYCISCDASVSQLKCVSVSHTIKVVAISSQEAIHC